MDFFTFVITQKLSLDIEEDWFRDLWFPLNLAQYEKDIIKLQKIVITDNILTFLGYK